MRKKKSQVYYTPYLDQVLKEEQNRGVKSVSGSLSAANQLPLDPFEQTKSDEVDYFAPEDDHEMSWTTSWNMLVEKIAGGNVDYDDRKLSDIARQRDDLSMIAEYKHLLQTQDKLLSDIRTDNVDDGVSIEDKLAEARRLQYKINDYENYFQTDGRQSDVVLNLLYNLDAIGNSLEAWKKHVDSHFLSQAMRDDIRIKSGKTDFWDNFAIGFSNFLNATYETLLSPSAYAIDRLLGENISGVKKGDWRRQILKAIPHQNSEEYKALESTFAPIIDSTFKGRRVLDYTEDDFTNLDQQLSDKFEDWRIRRDIDNDWKTKGNWHPFYWGSTNMLKGTPFNDFSFRISRPEDISEEDRKKQESVESFWSPSSWKYALPELGSSIGMMHYSLGSLAVDAALMASGDYLAQKLPVWLGKSLIKPIAVGGSLAFAAENVSKSRDMETSMEAIQAQQDRILQLAQKNGANLAYVGKQIRQKLSEVYPDVDLSKMEPEDYVRAAISFRIKTGDSAFDEAVKESEKGLNQLINANNALRVSDYLELLPFMNFGGSVIEGIASKIYHGIGDEMVKTGAHVFTSKTAAEIEKMAAPHIRAALGRVVDIGAAKFAGEGAQALKTFTAMKGDRLLKSIGRTGLKMTGVGITESFEEGVQELLQARYARGEYDDYSKAKETFSVPELFHTAELANQALLDYFGLDPDDPENGSFRIRKAMATGAAAGIMMSTLYGVTPKAVRSTYNTITGNPFDQSKSDWAFAKMVADDFKTEQDTRHLQIYYDMLHHGRKAASIQESLNTYIDMAKAESGLINPDYVVRDKKLAQTISVLYQDKKLNDAIKQTLADKNNANAGAQGTEAHREVLVQIAKKNIDINDAFDLGNKALSQQIELLAKRDQIINQILDQGTNETQRQQLESENPKLAELIRKYSEQYAKAAIPNLEKEISNKFLSNPQLFANNKHVQNILVDLGLAENTELARLFILEHYNQPSSYNQKIFSDIAQKAAKKQAVDEAMTREKYVKRQLNLLEKWHVINRIKALEKIFGDRAELLKVFRKVTGTDIDPNRTLGIKDKLESMRNRLGAIPQHVLSVFDNLASEDSFFDNQAELDEIIKNQYLNHAIAHTLLDIYKVYQGKMSEESAAIIAPKSNISTTNMGNALFGKDIWADSELKSLSEQEKEVDKWLEENENSTPTGVTPKEQANRVAEKQIEKADIIHKTFDWLIKQDAKLPENRRLIAHKSFTDIEQDIIPEDVEQQNASVEAPTETVINVEPETNLDNEPEPQVTIEPEPSVSIEPEPTYRPTDNNSTEVSEDEEPEVTPEAEEPEPLPSDIPQENIDVFQNNGQPAEDRIVSEDDGDALQAEEPEVTGDEEPETIPDVEPEIQLEAEELEPDVVNNEPEQQVVDVEPEPFDFNWKHVRIIENDGVYRIFYRDREITDEYTKQRILQELSLLSQDGTFDVSQVYADGEQNGLKVNIANLGSVVSQTFFFDPNPRIGDDGEIITVHPSVGDEKIALKYELGNGRELADKLAKRGFLTAKTTNIYYVVGKPARLVSEESLEKGSDIRDALQIAMVIEDNAGKKSYVTYLRSLGNYRATDDAQAKNEEAILRTWIRSKSADWNKITGGIIPESQAARIGAYDHAFKQLFEEKLKSQYRIETGINPDKNSQTKAIYENWRFGRGLSDEEKMIRKSLIDRISTVTQKQLSYAGASIISNEQIDREIDKLREFRNQIIAAYLGETFSLENISTNYNDSVKPSAVSQSNGKFNNQKEKEGSIKPKVFSVLKGTIDQITKALQSGALQIGIGKGLFGNPPFSIFNALDLEDIFGGKGLSGKLYQLITGPATTNAKVPAMLIEQRFLTQYKMENGKLVEKPMGDKESIQLCLDAQGRVDPNITEWLPSAAEAILHLLCNRVNGLQTTPEMVEFFLHNGDKTILDNQNIESGGIMDAFASKQIRYNPNTDTLDIAIQEDGVYKLKTFNCKQLFVNEADKRTVVHAIATQMHWNTEKEFIGATIKISGEDPLSSFISSLIANYVDKTQPENKQVIRILDCPQLSFSISDFLDEQTGQPKDVSVLAWLLKEKKVYTDIDPENQFKDPFVFATGVKKQSIEQPKSNKKEEGNPNGPINSASNSVRSIAQALVDFARSTKEQILNLLNVAKNGQFTPEGVKNWLIFDNDTESRQSFNSAQDALRFPLQDRFMLVPYKNVTEMTAEESLSRIQEYLKQKYSGEFGEKLLKAFDKKKDKILNTLSSVKNLSEFNNGQRVIMIEIPRSGDDILVSYLPLTGNNQSLARYVTSGKTSSQKKFTGVFSTKKAKTKGVDISQAREWLKQHLGLNDNQVIAATATLREMTNDEVFAVTNISINKVAERLYPFIALSERGEYGIQYHEAFHFVNLLMHTKQERAKLYADFIKQNKWAYDLTYDKIEEIIADRFMDYMLGYDPISSTKIGRFFRNVYEFILLNIFNRNGYRTVFNKIRQGGYLNTDLDKQSIEEFHKKYQQGVFYNKFHIYGATDDQIAKNFPSIEEPQDFYAASNAVVNTILSNYDFKTLESLHNIKLSMNDIYSLIDDLIDRCDNSTLKAQLQDLHDPTNQAVLIEVLKQRLNDIGIKILDSRKKISVDAEEREKRNDDAFNWFQFEFSKKDNATNAVKLLLSTLPKQIKLPDGQYIDEVDEYGAVQLLDYNEVYRKLLETAWHCTSFDKLINGQYDEYSLMGILSTHAKVDVVFHTLLETIESLLDSNIKSQLYTTVNSSLQNIEVLELADPEVQQRRSMSDFDEPEPEDVEFNLSDENLVNDRERIWQFLGDRNIRIARRLPSQWSSLLVMNGLVGSDRTKISEQYIKDLKKLFYGDAKSTDISFQTIAKKLYESSTDKNIDQQSLEVQYNDALEVLKNVLLKLAIPVDNATVNTFVQMKAGLAKTTLKDKIKALYLISSEKTNGSIREIVDTICENNVDIQRGTIRNSVSKSVSYHINELMNRRSETSDIGKLAVSYDVIHPSSEELSIIDSKGNRLYPISQNNSQTAIIRTLNNERSDYTSKIRLCPYCQHNMLLDAADAIDPNDVTSNIKLTLFVGLKDKNRKDGKDYFEITAKEDVLSKMFMMERSMLGLGDDQMVDPTMADKKTFYGISSPHIKLLHDVYRLGIPQEDIDNIKLEQFKKYHSDVVEDILNRYKTPLEQSAQLQIAANKRYSELSEMAELSTLVQPGDIAEWQEYSQLYYDQLQLHSPLEISSGGVDFQLSERAISIFINRMRDEIDALIAYYSKSHVQSMIKRSQDLLDNYHGSVESGRIMFDGNGGLMRYFYDVLTFDHKDPQTGKTVSLNLNQHLQALWELQRKIEAGEVENINPSGEKYVGTNNFTNSLDLDGFELVREELQAIKQKYFSSIIYINDELNQKMNSWLMQHISHHLNKFTTSGDQVQFGVKQNGMYIPTNIPQQLLQPYMKQLSAYGAKQADSPYSKFNDDYAKQLAFISLITNFVLNGMISTIDIEKIITGDPAYFKYTKSGKQDVKITYNGPISSGTATVSVDIITDTYSDKVKRLGSTQSPGEEVRIFYNPQEADIDPTLSTPYYSVLDMEDVEVQSDFIEYLTAQMKIQGMVDIVQHRLGDSINTFISQYATNNNISEEDAVDKIITELYLSNGVDNSIFDTIYSKILSEDQKKKLDASVDKKTGPYFNINVTDAQTIVSPSLYRRIRIGLGQWTGLCYPNEDAEEGTDEWAYRILEKNDNWMSDSRLAKALRHFEIYPLKMVYMQNSPAYITGNSETVPILNKMAMFPLFKMHRSTTVGRQLYDRMNNSELGQIDMLAFKSAVKIGATKNAYSPTKDVSDKSSQINPAIFNPSSKVIDYSTGSYVDQLYDELLPVKVQSLDNLRMQLNTSSHKDEERNLGTQILKIAFANILPLGLYKNSKGDTVTGRDLIQEIFKLVNLLSALGKEKIDSRYKSDGKVDQQAVIDLLRKIVNNNNLGFYADELLEQGGCIQSMQSSGVFEQSIASTVLDEVVSIPTTGGSAIQQSSFWFNQYQNGTSLQSQTGDAYVQYNDGEKLKWIKDDNSMEILLSIKFLLPAIPSLYRGEAYKFTRQYLIDHGFINGHKSNRKYIGEDPIFNKSIDDFIAEFSDDLYVEIKSNDNIKTIEDLYRTFVYGNIKRKQELKKIFDKFNITNYSVAQERSIAQNPFGIGYRIPTQGLSSAFAFTVADVLPEHVGDLLIVPEEFTAQTGSDFDVDKVYLATLSYKDGQLQEYSEDNLTKRGISNALLQTFINIITDPKNFSLARGSIDVLTSKIKKDFVKGVLRQGNNQYLRGGLSATPLFQASRKAEFVTGKNGISVAALAITNLALTQATELTIDFSKNIYNLGDLYEIYGQDGEYISDWLSAMVNAHVDVAKDAYIFDINVNPCTWNHMAFLIRAGKGMGTFTFLAQQILTEYANNVNNSSGIYGNNVDLQNTSDYTESVQMREYIRILNKYVNYLESVFANNSSYFTNEEVKLFTHLAEYAKMLTNPRKYKKSLGKEQYKKRLQYYTNEYSSGVFGNLQSLFDENSGINIIKIRQQKINFVDNVPVYDKSNISDVAKYFAWQILTLIAYHDIQSYADQLQNLVQLSQIDTRKFGNTIMLMWNYLHRINSYISSDKVWMSKKVSNSNENYMPLEVYFGDTWLMDKLQKTIEIMCDILSEQTYSAQDAYRQIFNKVAQLMYGTEHVESNAFTDEYDGYTPIKSEKDVVLITQMIDRVLEFNAMFNLSSNFATSGDVDLSFGGNIQLLMQNINRIMFGTANQKDLFQRTNDLIKKISESDDAIYFDLKQGDQISNEFLNFIIPIPPTRKSIIGKIALKSQVSRLGDTKKKQLAYAIEQLINHEDVEIRDWMRDMIIYAYYSHNNRNVYDAFFELVPISARQSFDTSIKQSVFDLGNNPEQCGYLGVSFGDDITSEMSILDAICRNNWMDDKLVPIKSAAGSYATFSMPNKKVPTRIFLRKVYNHIDKLQYHRAIILSAAKGSIVKQYIKEAGGQLYHLSGTLSVNDPNINDPIVRYIYLPTEKAGLGREFQEPWCVFGVPSLFEQNQLPEILTEAETQKFVEDQINNYPLPEGFSVNIQWSVDPITIKHSTKQAITSRQYSSIVSLRTVPVKRALLYAKRNSDVILYFSTQDLNLNAIEKDDALRQKTVVINLTDIEKSKQRLIALSENLSNPILLLNTAMYDSQLIKTFATNEQEVQRELEKLFNEYMSVGKRRISTIEEFSKLKNGMYVNIARKNVALRILNSKIQTLLQSLQSIGGIATYISEGRSILTKIQSVLAYNVFSSLGDNLQFDTPLYIDKTYAGSMDYKKTTGVINKDVKRITESVESNEATEEQLAIEQIMPEQKIPKAPTEQTKEQTTKSGEDTPLINESNNSKEHENC